MSNLVWSVPCFATCPPAPSNEAPLSRFYRRGHENGFADPWELVLLAGFEGERSWSDPAVMDRIEELYSRGDEPLIETRAGGGGEREIRVGEGWVPARLVDFRGAAVCPRCLAEEPYRRSLWDLRAFLCCPRHGVWLVSRCDGCCGSVELGVSNLLRCRCGRDLRDAPADAAPATVVALHALMARAAHGPARPSSGKGAAAPTDLGLGDLVTLALCLGPHPATRSPFEAPAGKSRDEMRAVIAGAARLLVDWPGSFGAAVRASLRGPGGGALSVHWRNEGTWRALTDDLREPQFDFLRQAFEQVRRALWNEYRRRAGTALPAASKVTDDLVGLTDAASLLGLHRREVRQLVEARVLGAAADCRRGDARNWLFAREDLLGLLEGFASRIQAPPVTGFTVGIPFDRARDATAAAGGGLASLVAAVCAGEVPVVGMDGKKAGLYRFDLSLPALADLLLGEAAPEAHFAWRNVPAFLGLPMKACEWLAAQGILERSGPWHGETVSAARLLAVVKDVIAVRRVRTGAGTAFGASRLNPARVGFALLGSPADGCPVILCERRVLEEALAAPAPAGAACGKASGGPECQPDRVPGALGAGRVSVTAGGS